MVTAIKPTVIGSQTPHESLINYIKIGFNDEAACIQFLKSDGAKNIPASGDNGLAGALMTALHLSKKDVAKAILGHPNAKNLSGLALGYALRETTGNLEKLDLFNLISKHPNAKDIDALDLDIALLYYCTTIGYPELIKEDSIANFILAHPNATQIPGTLLPNDPQWSVGLGDFLISFLSGGKLDFAQKILQFPNAKDISGEDLGKALPEAVKLENPAIFDFLLSKHPNSKNISGECLGSALVAATKCNKGAQAMAVLTHSKAKEIPNNPVSYISNSLTATLDKGQFDLSIQILEFCQNSEIDCVNLFAHCDFDFQGIPEAVVEAMFKLPKISENLRHLLVDAIYSGKVALARIFLKHPTAKVILANALEFQMILALSIKHTQDLSIDFLPKIKEFPAGNFTSQPIDPSSKKPYLIHGLEYYLSLAINYDRIQVADAILQLPNAKDISVNVLLKLENLFGEKTERIRTVLQNAKNLQRKRIFTALFILLSIMVIAVLVLFRKKHKLGR